MNWLTKILKQRPDATTEAKHTVRQTTFSDPFVISSPKMGILNLLGKSGDAIVEEDRLGLSPLFASCVEGQITPPRCDVLLLYCNIDSNGILIGASDTLGEIVHKSRAPIAFVASPNSANAYIASGKRAREAHANLVMTLDRKGTHFTGFCQKLFRLMKQGKSMPMAWAELAPQGPAMEESENPDTIFLCNAGHIVFR